MLAALKAVKTMNAVTTSEKWFQFTLCAANTNAESDLGLAHTSGGAAPGIVQGCAGRHGSVESTLRAIIIAARMYTKPTTIGTLVAGLFNLVIGTCRFGITWPSSRAPGATSLVEAFASSAVAAVISMPIKAKAAMRKDILVAINMCATASKLILTKMQMLGSW